MRIGAAAVLFFFACGGASRESRTAEQIDLGPPPPAAGAAPPARTELALGQIVVSATSDTPTPDAEIRGQLVSWANGTRGCWYARGGRFDLDFVVGIHGNVFDARVEGQDTAAADCAKNRLVAWRFPEAPMSTHVTATIVARGSEMTGEPGKVGNAFAAR
jgi:hypothetical protein